MRLIDADELKISISQNNKIPRIFQQVINAQPTAYSVDEVIKELEENASRYTKKYTTPYGDNVYKDTKAISVNKAIKIVKAGAKNEN